MHDLGVFAFSSDAQVHDLSSCSILRTYNRLVAIDQAASAESCSDNPVVLDELTHQTSPADPITVSELAHVKLGWRT